MEKRKKIVKVVKKEDSKSGKKQTKDICGVDEMSEFYFNSKKTRFFSRIIFLEQQETS